MKHDCFPTLRRETFFPQLYPHLINGYIVARLLEARDVVVAVPHHNPDLMENYRANQLIGALHLHHD